MEGLFTENGNEIDEALSPVTRPDPSSLSNVQYYRTRTIIIK